MTQGKEAAQFGGTKTRSDKEEEEVLIVAFSPHICSCGWGFFHTILLPGIFLQSITSLI